MTLDRIVICMLGVPIAGIARFRALSARQFILGDRELVAFTRLDHEVAPVVLADPAGDGAAEVAMAQAVENDLADPIERLAELRPAGPAGIGWGGFSSIVQQRLHVLYSGGECERRHRRPVAVERQHVLAPGWPVAKDEDLAPALGTQIDQLVAGAAQKTGEIEVAGFEPAITSFCAAFRR